MQQHNERWTPLPIRRAKKRGIRQREILAEFRMLEVELQQDIEEFIRIEKQFREECDPANYDQYVAMMMPFIPSPDEELDYWDC